MEEFKDLYFQIFNKLTDLTEEIKKLQQQMEEMYINTIDNN